MRALLNRLAIRWLGGEAWVTDLIQWNEKIQLAGAHGLNPALRETFIEKVASGADVEDAACRALEGVDMVEIIAELGDE